MSWTGSEKQRREQGVCKPPAKVKLVYRVRGNSPCKIRRVANISNGVGPWRDYVSSHCNYFERTEYPKSYRRGWFVFRPELSDWELMVQDKYVDIVYQ